MRVRTLNVIGVFVCHSRFQSITRIEMEHWLLAKRHVDIVNIREHRLLETCWDKLLTSVIISKVDRNLV